MAKAMNVADAIITLCNKKFKCGTKGSQYKYPISNLYLQKLMYFLNVIHMLWKNSYNKPLITNDVFEKWTYGPVIYSVYEEYKGFNGDHITRTVPHVIDIKTTQNGSILEIASQFHDSELKQNYGKFIMKNIPILLKIKPFDLVDISHNEPQWRHKTRKNEYYDNLKSMDHYKNLTNLRGILKAYE